MVAVIVVTRLNGPRFAVNPDLLQRIESAPDTVLTLFDGTKYIVEESPEEVIELIRDDRARVIARAQQIQREDATIHLVADDVPAAGAAQTAAVGACSSDGEERLARTVPLRPRRR